MMTFDLFTPTHKTQTTNQSTVSYSVSYCYLSFAAICMFSRIPPICFVEPLYRFRITGPTYCFCSFSISVFSMI